MFTIDSPELIELCQRLDVKIIAVKDESRERGGRYLEITVEAEFGQKTGCLIYEESTRHKALPLIAAFFTDWTSEA